MEYLTKLHDTDLYIFSLLDYLTILNLKESCKYFYRIKQTNIFWQKYLYTELIKHKINPQQLEKYRPMIEPYNISYRNYYVTTSIEQAIKDNRFDAVIYLKIHKLKPCIYDVAKACDNTHIKALDFLNDEYGLLPAGKEANHEMNNYCDHSIKHELKRRTDIPSNEYTLTVIQSPLGVSGPPPEPFICHALPRLIDNYNHKEYRSDSYNFAYNMALRRGKIKLLDWLYNKNIIPTNYLTGNAIGYSPNSVSWLKAINERDNLKLEILDGNDSDDYYNHRN